MQFREVARPQYTQNIRHAVAAGKADNCPFCRGRMLGRPAPGSKIQLLMGIRSGWVGTVASHTYAWGADEFCVRFDEDPPGDLQRVLLRHDQYVTEPFGDPPDWMPPLATDDLAHVDEFVIRFCTALFQNDRWRWRDEELFTPIMMSWGHRLPVRGKEIWAMCAAHGLPHHFKKKFVSAFDFGFNLIVFGQGRPPIKRRRVPAMSIARYEPKRRK